MSASGEAALPSSNSFFGGGEKVITLVQNQGRHSSGSKRKTKTKLRPVVQLRPLSAEELCQVNLATFREGFNHCRWPKDVIEKLLTVQV